MKKDEKGEMGWEKMGWEDWKDSRNEKTLKIKTIIVTNFVLGV